MQEAHTPDNTRHQPAWTRRRFLKHAAGAAAVLVAPSIVPAAALGRNGNVAPAERLAFGVIGYGNRFRRVLLPWFLGFKEVQFLAICDCWEERRAAGKRAVDAHYGNGDCRTYARIPDILAREDIDGLIIATGDRMHAVASIMAAKAGKDVYSEQPHSLTVEEGQALVRTTARCNTVFQCGHQRRSVDTYRFQKDVVRKGLIGNVHTVYMKTWLTAPAGPLKDAPVPPGLDWDEWLGPTPYHRFNPRRLAWNNFYDTGAGPMCNMGCHYTDLAQWALDRDHTGPIHLYGHGTL